MRWHLPSIVSLDGKIRLLLRTDLRGLFAGLAPDFPGLFSVSLDIEEAQRYAWRLN